MGPAERTFFAGAALDSNSCARSTSVEHSAMSISSISRLKPSSLPLRSGAQALGGPTDAVGSVGAPLCLVEAPLEQRRRRGLARNIRRAAGVRGIGLNQLSDRAGVSRAQLYAVLGGKSSPSLEWLCKVADALGVHPSALIEGIGTHGQP